MVRISFDKTKEKKMSKKLTLAEAKDLLVRFADLVDDGVIDDSASCDVEDLISDVHLVLNRSKNVSSVRLVMVLEDIEFPAGVDPYDQNAYDVTVRVKGKAPGCTFVDEIEVNDPV